MNQGIQVDVGGTVYVLPLNGDPITTDTGVIRYTGTVGDPIPSAQDLLDQRRAQILAAVPPAPEYTTIQEIIEADPGISRSSARRALLFLESTGTVRSSRPHSRQRGRVARRWSRV